MLGGRERGTARLEEAVAAHRAALEERTRERVPLDWAISTGDQGVALRVLAERTLEQATAQRAGYGGAELLLLKLESRSP